MAQNLSKAKIAKLTYKHTKVAKIFYIIYPSLISYQFVKAWYCFSNLRQNTKFWHTRCNRAGKNNRKRLVLHVNLISKMAAKLSFQSNRDHWDNAAILTAQRTKIRDLKIVVYGKRLTSDTLLAIKTKSLTVKYITYRIYSKYRKLPIDTLFNYRNEAVDIKWFCAQIAWRLPCTVWRLHFTIERLDKVTAAHCKRRTSTRTSSNGCPKLFPISDNVSVVIQGVLVQHFKFL